MTAVGLGQQGSQAVGPGSGLVSNTYMISLTFVKNSISMVPIAHWVGLQGFEAVGTSSNPNFYLHFLT